MKNMEPPKEWGIAVRILPAGTLSLCLGAGAATGETPLARHTSATGIPPRSRLYGLVPCAAGTMLGESLTSYVNRLGWAHGVAPRELVRQEMLPHLLSCFGDNRKQWLRAAPGLVSVFSRRGGAMSLNGMGIFAREGATLLERLTRQPDLQSLTLRWWLGELATAGNLRTVVTWCADCYAEWQGQGASVYQPLLWMLQVVTMCPRHKKRLLQCCPYCAQQQSVIATAKTGPGECTQCGHWLGTQSGAASVCAPEAEIDEEMTTWQEWVIQALAALRASDGSDAIPDWATFFTGFAAGMEEKGAFARLAAMTGIKRGVLYRWFSGACQPSLAYILYVCHVCGVTPREVMNNQIAPLRQALRSKTAVYPPLRVPRPARKMHQPADPDQGVELIQRVLDGREEALGITEIARRLGGSRYSVTSLLKQLPDVGAAITQHMREEGQQRKALRIGRSCEEVRQVVRALHGQGIAPSHRRVRELLSQPSAIRQPKVSAAWRAARKELGLEHTQLGRGVE